MKSRFTVVLAAICTVLAGTGLLNATTPGTAQNVQLVGQNPLFGRGMNAAATIFDHFLYVGNRTDGSSRCGIGDPRRTAPPPGGLNTCPHPNPGVLVLDINNPAAPTVVNEFGNEFTTGTFAGQTSRELRVWPAQKLLMIMYFRCSSFIHACTRPATDDWRIRFFDLSDPVHPALVSTYVPPSKPHEMFLWADPNNDKRALLFLSTPNLFADNNPNLIITDISQARSGVFTEIARGNWNNRFPGTNQANYPFGNSLGGDGCGPYDCNLFVHSMGVKPDGSVAYLALEAGHFLVLDTSQVAAGLSNPQLTLLTDPTNRPVWLQDPLDPAAVPGVFPGGCARQGPGPFFNPSSKDCPNSHSAVQVPGRKLALTTDEVYGTLTFDNQGCRWGWARLIDVSDPTRPFITGEYTIDENNLSFCGSPADDSVTESTRSYSSHNPTLTQNLAIIDWHSGGLQIIDTSDPTHPVQAGFFVPDPPASVANEDPALSQGTASRNNKTVFWSYPIINHGLIYVIDVRNGLFIFKYTGSHANEVSQIGLLEGNSNLGDAVDLDQNQNSH
jgi:hypothetical protein